MFPECFSKDNIAQNFSKRSKFGCFSGEKWVSSIEIPGMFQKR